MTFISYAQNYEDVILYRVLKGVEKGFYVDIGANDPVLNSVTKAFYERGWRGINIEPVRYWFDKLVADRPEDINLNFAISDKPGVVHLYDVLYTGLSTFSQELAEEHKKTGGYAYQEILVQALTLDEVLGTSSHNEIHFLNIDVEGAEGQVLAGIDLNRIRPWIIVVESTKPLSTTHNFEDWDSLLTGRGYVFVYFDGLNRFYLAKERDELSVAFNAPPNFFDDFVRFSEANNLALLNAKAAELQGLHSVVSVKDVELMGLQTSLSAKEVEHQQLESALYTKEVERQLLETALTAKEVERQQLESALNTKEAERQQLEISLDNTRRYQTELELRIHVLENELESQRSEAHHWWAEF